MADDTFDATAAVDSYLKGGTPSPSTPLRASLETAIPQNGDQVAEWRRVASTIGVPVDTAQAMPDYSKTQAALTSLDPENLMRLYPATSQLLANPDNAAVAHDDTGPLKALEGLFKAAPNRALTSLPGGNGPRVMGSEEFAQRVTEYQRRYPNLSPDEARSAAMQSVEIDNTAGERAQGFRPAPATFGNVMQGVWDQLLYGTKSGAAGLRMARADMQGNPEEKARELLNFVQSQNRAQQATPDFTDNKAGALVFGGAANLAQNAPGIALSIAMGNPLPALVMGGGQTAALGYGTASARGATPLQAAAVGGLQGAVEVGTEYLPMSFLVNAFGKTSLLKLFAGDQVREQIGEQVATHLQDAIDTAIANPNKTWKEYLQERPDAAAQTAVAVLMQGLALGGLHAAATSTQAGQARVQQAEADAALLEQMNTAASESKLRGRDPAAFDAFVQNAAGDGPVQDVYLSAAALAQSGITPEQLATLSPTAAQQLPEALAAGTDIRIPVGEYATTIAGTDEGTALLPHLRTAPDGWSKFESDAYMQSEAENLKQQSEQILADRSADETWQASVKAVEDKVLGQLSTAGRFSADVNAAYVKGFVAPFYNVMAARLGITPEEMFERYPLKVVAEHEGGPALDQGGLAKVAAQWDAAGIKNSLSENKGEITLSQIVVPEDERDSGKGTTAMQALVDYADKTGQRVVLTPSSDFGGSKTRLTEFYKRFGFVENKGKNKDFTTQERMIREPQALAQSPIQTDTPEFKQWFGESKLVNKDGTPEMLFHGTTADTDTLTPSTNGALGTGVYLTRDPDAAHMWADVKSQKTGGDQSIYPVYAALQNPASQDDVEKIIAALGGREVVNGEMLTAALQAAGYDGVIGKKAVVAFNSEQVKSAVGNRGTFNANDPSLLSQSPVENAAFKKWFEGSKIVNEDGTPLVMYHGTSRDVESFQAKQAGAIFLTPDPAFASRFAASSEQWMKGNGEGDKATQNILPVFVSAQNPFDLANAAHVDALLAERVKGRLPPWAKSNPQKLADYERARLESGQWTAIEDENMQIAMKSAGFDSFYVMENGVKNLAVYAPTQIKSAIGNNGNFSPSDSSILNQPAYHGTPHRFDKFSTDHMGSGEGAQAFGWGLYFAGKKAIAEHYRGALNYRKIVGEFREALPDDADFDEALQSAEDGDLPGGMARVIKALAANDWLGFDYPSQAITAAFKELDAFPDVSPELQAATKAYGGQLYEVDIPEDSEMLLWDKPLSEQPEVVQEALAKLDPDTYAKSGEDYDANEPGQMVYQRLASTLSKPDPAPNWTSVSVDSDGRAWSGQRAASEALLAAGIKGIKYLDGGSRNVGDGTHNYVVFSGDDVAIRNQFYQKDKQSGNRGSFNPDTNTIALLRNSDLSTFIHESGHFFLEAMADIAGRPDAPADIKADMDALLKWFEVPDHATWAGMTLDEKRDSHEQFARGFEAYMFEGKAPSLALQPMFSRFRAWLMNLYKAIRNLNVELTDEVRGVMDRMLASDAQIREAQAARDFAPLFKSPEDGGMDGPTWEEYRANVQDATQEALDHFVARSLRDMKWLHNAHGRELKKLQAEAAEKRKIVEREVTTEVDAMPVYSAVKWLRTGKTIDPVTGEAIQSEGSHRIGTADLEAMYPEQAEGVPDWRSLTGMTSRDGIAADFVADMFGFDSPDAMVRELVDRESRESVIEGMTDQRMLERYGDLNSPEAIERAADIAVHNNLRIKVLATEHDALAKATGQPRILAKAAKQFAETIIARKRIRDIRPAQYAAAESRAAKAADKARRANQLATAAVEKRNQIVNSYASKAAYDALDEVDKALAYFDRIDTKGARANRRGEQLVQRDALLARFDLRRSLSNKEIDAKKMPLAEFLTSEAERLSAVVPDLAPDLLNENYRKHYRDMSVEEFRGLVDAVKQLDRLARREEQQYQAIRNQNFSEEREAVLAVLRREHPDAFDEDGAPKGLAPDFVPSLGKGLEKLGDKFIGEFLSAERIMALLEHGAPGPVWESLFGRMSHQSDWKAHTLGALYKELEPAFAQYNYAERVAFGRRGYAIPEIGTSLTRENMLAVALLNGNAEGRDRLANYGWGPEKVAAIIAKLDARDMKLADAIWRMFDEKLWPQLKQLNDRTRGKSPPKVEPTPYTTTHGEARGGYFPLKYDTDLDERAHRFDESQAVQNLLGGSVYGMSAKTNQGASNERRDNVSLRPRLSLAVFAEAVTETVHDLAYREAVADTMRMLNDRAIQHAVKQAVGTQGYRALVTRVREVAAPPRNPSGFVEKALSIARKNTVVTLMSGALTALQNFTGLAPALARVNSGLLLREVLRFTSPQMLDRTRFAMDQSLYLQGRFQNYDRDLREVTNKLTVNGKILPDTAGFLFLMGYIDRAVAVPIWNAAFAEGMKLHENDQPRAVDHADSVVRMTQGSGREVDLAGIMSGHGGYGQLKKIFTMFYSYFNGQLGLLVETGAIAKHEAKENAPLALAKFTAKFVGIIVVPVILTEWLMHGIHADDDPDKQVRRWVKAFALYGAGMFPLVRDVAGFAAAKLDPDAKHNNQSFRVSPVESAVEGAAKAGPALVQLAKGEGDEKATKDAIMGTSFIFGLPGKLIVDVTLGTKAFLEGKTSNPAAMVIGPPKKE